MSGTNGSEVDIEQLLATLTLGTGADGRIAVLQTALGDIKKLAGDSHGNERLAYGAFAMSLWAALVAENEALLNAAAREESMQFIRDYADGGKP
jgi:hypothetical protein